MQIFQLKPQFQELGAEVQRVRKNSRRRVWRWNSKRQKKNHPALGLALSRRAPKNTLGTKSLRNSPVKSQFSSKASPLNLNPHRPRANHSPEAPKHLSTTHKYSNKTFPRTICASPAIVLAKVRWQRSEVTSSKERSWVNSRFLKQTSTAPITL